MPKNLTPWWKNQQWAVLAHTPQGWQPIYHTEKKADAQHDARRWEKDRGQQCEVVRGPGHKDFRVTGRA